jgi:peptide deformylase
MEIVKYCHPVLRWKSKPLPEITDELRATVRQMFDIMYAAKGIGLAANQVGLPYRFFIANVSGEPEEKDEEIVFINPKILKKTGCEDAQEGCLSLPDLYGKVPRATHVVLEAFDLEGDEYEIEADDLMARVILHEYDHIEGVLFIDRMSKVDREEIATKVDQFEFDFRRDQKLGKIPSDTELKARLAELETTFQFPG